MFACRTRWLAMFALVVILSGCSIGDVRRTPSAPAPEPPSSAAPGQPPSPEPVAEIRRTRLAVPERYDQPYVEFVDAEQGYALFGACDGQPPGPECRALLFATRDGGRSWQKLRHPKPIADNQQLYAAPGMLALWTEPHGWWTSPDGGRTFRHSPGEAAPLEWQATRGRFQIIEDTGRVGRWDGRGLRPLPAQPPLPALTTVVEVVNGDGAGHSGPVVAAGASEDGRLYAAISWDEGRRWQKTPVPAPDGEVGVLWVEVAAGEVWLVGERPDRISFPALWRLEGREWKVVSAEGHPDAGRAVPIGGGLAAVVSRRGAGAVADGRYVDLPWPLTSDHYLRLLPDGTLFAGASEGVLLGTGPVADRTWAAVILETD